MRTEFVGRERELSVLTAALGDARAGRPRLVLCRGEPGIGKTRLAEELVARADGVGGRVGHGHGGRRGAAVLAMATGAARAEPRHRHRCGRRRTRRSPRTWPGWPLSFSRSRPPSRRAAGSGEDRFRLFDGVARLLGALAGPRPVLVVLDDAQWADQGSLLLLRHVAHGLDRERLLLLVNHRDTGPVPAVLATELLREPWTWPLDVRGLPAPDVARQLSALVRREVPEREAARVHARTGGNPFFVGEVGRILLDDRERSGSVPPSVREAIGARLARLAPATVRVLQAAAIVGREFRAAVVAAMVDAPVLACLAALDEAASARAGRAVADTGPAPLRPRPGARRGGGGPGHPGPGAAAPQRRGRRRGGRRRAGAAASRRPGAALGGRGRRG